MWIQFFCAAALALACLVLPGFLIARGMGARAEFALGVAPLVTLACYGVMSIVFGATGIPCGWFSLPLPLIVIGAAMWVVARRRGRGVELGFSAEAERPFAETGLASWLSPVRLGMLLAVAAAIATSLAVYVLNIGEPDAFIQNYDNAAHLSRIHLFATTQNYSTLLGGTYPSAWHGIAALVESTLGVSSMMAEHAANLAFIVGAYPIGTVFLAAVLSPERRRVVWMSGLLCLSFGFFPWRIMLFGPLYPNLAAFCLMPAVAALFILLCAPKVGAPERIRYGVLFVLGGMAMALSQPNAIFSTGVFLIPFCVWRVYRLVAEALGDRKRKAIIAVAAAAGVAVLFAALWYALSQMPFMASIVYYYRDTPLDFAQAVRWALGFSFVIKRQQYLIAMVVALGALVLLVRPRTRWVVFSFALIMFLFAVSISIEHPIANILVGFWYSDYYRLAATACVFAVPLVATGMDAVASGVQWCAGKLAVRAEGDRARSLKMAGSVAAGAAVAVIMAINYVPFEFIGQYYRSYGFDAVAYEMRDMYQDESKVVVGPEEIAFLEEVAQIVPAGEVIMNVPYDGSVFGYVLSDLDLVYNSFGFDPTAEAGVLREGVDRIATDADVQAAAETEGVRWVLQLDQGTGPQHFNEDGSIYPFGYYIESWLGITGVNDDTPGLECVLAEGDMRLYRIEY